MTQRKSSKSNSRRSRGGDRISPERIPRAESMPVPVDVEPSMLPSLIFHTPPTARELLKSFSFFQRHQSQPARVSSNCHPRFILR